MLSAEEKNHARSLLKGNQVFDMLLDQELETLMKITERRDYAKNRSVFSVNQKASHFFLVEEGTFILNLRNRNFKTFTRGDLFGEIAVINEKLRTGSIRALEDSSLLAINGQHLFDESYIPAALALKVTRALAQKVTNYLRTREQISTEELIEQGENDHVEFKSSLRWNPQTQEKDNLVEYAVLKALSGFLNAKGGTLLIGVQDDREVLGIGEDRFENFDKLVLHLTKLVKEKISPIHMEFVGFEIEEIRDKHVLRLDIEAATTPAYLREHTRENFYVRTGPATSRFKTSKVYDYVRMRF